MGMNDLEKQKLMQSLMTQNQAQNATLRQLSPEVLEGQALKRKFLNELSVPASAVNIPNSIYEQRADAAGVVPNAYEMPGMRTDSPGFTYEQSGRNPLLLNKPMYEELLKELHQK